MSQATPDVYNSEMPKIDIYTLRPKFKSEKFTDYAKRLPQIRFEAQWMDPKTYSLEGMVTLNLGLKSGEVRGFVDKFGRRGVVVGTRFGNIIGYQQHGGHCDQVVTKVPDEIYAIYHTLITGWLDIPKQEILFGLNDITNIGAVLG